MFLNFLLMKRIYFKDFEHFSLIKFVKLLVCLPSLELLVEDMNCMVPVVDTVELP